MPDLHPKTRSKLGLETEGKLSARKSLKLSLINKNSLAETYREVLKHIGFSSSGVIWGIPNP